MKKYFITCMMMLLGLFAAVTSTWGQEEAATIYLASLKAQTDPASTGSGQVKLTWLDITGRPMYVDLAKQINYFGFGDESWMAKESAYDGPAATAQVLGGTMIAIDGMETPMEMGGSGSQIYMTSFLYFHAEAEPANGSYLADWTFTGADAAYITRMTGTSIPPAPTDPMGDGSEERPFRTPCFKVLPKVENSTPYTDAPEEPSAPVEPQRENYFSDEDYNSDMENYNAQMVDYNAAMLAYATEMQTWVQNYYNPLVTLAQDVVQNKYNTLYAVFRKYLLSNPVAKNANVEAELNATADLSVTVEVDGDAASLDAEDFVAFSFTNNGSGEWTYDLAAALEDKEVVSEQKTKIVIPITYTYKGGGYGTKNTTMTISMAGASPSSLEVNLSVVALDPTRPEALLLEGKDDASPVGGTLDAILSTDISGYTNPIVKLNRAHSAAVTLPSKKFTFDLNGNEAGNITIAGGEVTIAYSSFGGEASALNVTGGKAILNGGTFASLTVSAGATVEQNGATITGAASNAGTLTTTDGIFENGLASTGTLTLNGGRFNGTTAVTVSGGTANINRGTLNGSTVGLLVSGGTANVKKLAVINSEGSYSAQRTAGTLNVESGKFGKPLNGAVNFTAGFFKDTNYGVSAGGKKEFLISAGVEYNEGYRYFLGTSETALANGVGVCRIGNVSYSRLEDAIAYANNNPAVENIVIFMTNDYILPAGYYTLPANATIVVPMSDSQEKAVNPTAPRIIFNDQKTETPYTSIIPTEFRRLTFASGVNLDVFGDIELTCSQYASNEAYTSQPVGPYGRLVMEEGSHMTLQNGSEVRAWGFITGKGETDARRGSTVREMFQLGDWKGAMTSVAITGLVTSENELLCGVVKSQGKVDDCDYSEKKIFPVTQYFIQNVESPVKYHPGALLSTSAAVSEGLLGMSVSMAATDIAVVGVNGQHQAIFLMDQMADADNTWVRKWYDVENDIQVYDINSAAHIGSMVLDMGDINLLTYGTVPIRLNSAKFDLPLTCNFKIHLLSGTMDFQQNTSLLPGAEVEVDKEATVTVAMDEDEIDAYDEWVDGGKIGDAPVAYTGALYVYDAAEWDKYAYCNEYNGEELVKGKAYTKTVRYAPSWNGRPTKRNEQICPADAAINVHGTFKTATGFVYTSESGANIFSSNEDAGTFIFNDDAVNAGTRIVNNVKGTKDYVELTFYPARLKHGDGTYENTDEAVADLAYCYQNDRWSTMVQDGCFMKENRGGNDIYYAKPQDYVALANGKTENADHTYSDAAGAGRLFILMDGCQWWEVENVDNLYHCIHPENNTYYYWVDEVIDKHGSEDPEEWDIYPGHWAEKKYTITWINWDGEPIATNNGTAAGYEVTYGTMAEFLGTNPTRESNIDYTYDFTGWSPALGPVTSDVTYTATFEQKDRMYTVIFQNEGGTEIERQFLKHNDIPVCENTPTKTGHTLVWSPAVAAVTGDATYTATWLENPPTEYEVTFYDYNGTTVLKQGNVNVGEMPVSPAIVDDIPTGSEGKPATSEFTYVFDHWSPALETVSATSIKSYTAVYREVARKYNVRFEDEDGSEIETNQYSYGETPVCSATPTKDNTDQYTYSFAWTPQIQTVQGAATYRAVFTPTTNKYTVTLTSNLSGVCTFTGAGTFDYGTTIDNIAVSYNDTKYEFTGWSDGEEDAAHPSFTLEGNIALTANFTPLAIEDHTVATNEAWSVPVDTEVKDLIITSDGSECGQLLNPENLTIRGEAIFRLNQSFDAGKWYAVAVPWRVNPASGIYGASSRLASGSQIYIIEFDGAAYAQVGGTEDTYQYWHFLHQTGADMVPGKLYMIYLASGQSKLDFHKKAGAALQTRNLTVSTASGSAGASFANWNAISNPALYTADLSTGVTAYQTYDNNDGQTYTVVDAATSGLIVAKPIFVQVNTPGTVYATVPAVAPAPYRRAAQTENDAKYVVEIARDGKMADRLIVKTAEEKEDKYIIGQDLSKFGVSSKVAQMWINRYDAKLCMNTMAMNSDQTEYPLTIFVPKAGEYTISSNQLSVVSDQMALYLTYNGEAIWNLSEGAYTADFSKGTDANYGLRVSAKAPQVTTGIDEAIVDSKDAVAAKVLIGNQVFIIRGEKVYSIDGQLVK